MAETTAEHHGRALRPMPNVMGCCFHLGPICPTSLAHRRLRDMEALGSDPGGRRALQGLRRPQLRRNLSRRIHAATGGGRGVGALVLLRVRQHRPRFAAQEARHSRLRRLCGRVSPVRLPGALAATRSGQGRVLAHRGAKSHGQSAERPVNYLLTRASPVTVDYYTLAVRPHLLGPGSRHWP